MNFGFSGEIVFIMLLALILFGPRRMPEIARQIGRFMADFKNASNALEARSIEEMRKLEMESGLPAATRADGEDVSHAGDEMAAKA